MGKAFSRLEHAIEDVCEGAASGLGFQKGTKGHEVASAVIGIGGGVVVGTAFAAAPVVTAAAASFAAAVKKLSE